MPINEYNQIIADDLPTWTPRDHVENVTLKGKFCTLEPLDMEVHGQDLYDAYETVGDDRMWTYFPVGPFPTIDSYVCDWVALLEGKRDVHFAIVDNTTHKAVGQFALRRCFAEHGTVEEGYVAFSPLLQKTKMATEAHYLLANYVLSTLGYRRLEWQCVDLNMPSHNAAVRLGFKCEGTLRQNMVFRGKTRDTTWLSLIDKDWPVCQRAFELWLADDNFDADGRQKASLATIREGLTT
ncbi:hypothetical protein DAKH74_003850 [Maudiozyma humilis]|uniref:N-acetyltransferase domain-containing protein n=1 Tax=Maudiozyma humilis TaxID=51915 RepID=A0AAV5RQF9_MAUHU|nr:hypothetical protein DAKH74_003850 [Kazachstania humilis]